MNHRDYYRRAAGRRTREEGDSIATALTIQVILAVILVLTAVIVKKSDEAKYREFKAAYQIMAADPAESGKVWALFSGDGARRFFTGLEDAVASALAGLTGAQQPAEREETPRGDLIEPQPELEVVTEPPTDSAGIPAFDYDVSLPEAMASLGEIGTDVIRPETLSYTFPEELPVPAGCTMAPVILRANLQPPVTGVITSGFAYREHPITGGRDFHNGMDIAAEAGGDVHAALAGEVTETGWSEVYGNYLVLRHADNFETFYGHCAALLAEEGDEISGGDAIARVGDTGLTTGPHLHFSVIVSGQFTDPYWVLRDCIRPVQ